MSRFDLLKDRRERIVRPHKLAPLLAELMLALQQIFEACYATTHDTHWLDGADRVFRARREIVEWATKAGMTAIEANPERGRFAGKIVGLASTMRKPQAWLSSTEDWITRKVRAARAARGETETRGERRARLQKERGEAARSETPAASDPRRRIGS